VDLHSRRRDEERGSGFDESAGGEKIPYPLFDLGADLHCVSSPRIEDSFHELRFSRFSRPSQDLGAVSLVFGLDRNEIADPKGIVPYGFHLNELVFIPKGQFSRVFEMTYSGNFTVADFTHESLRFKPLLAVPRK